MSIQNEVDKYEKNSLHNSEETNDVVCFFNTTNSWGGGEKWHFNSATYLHSRNHNISFVCSQGSELEKKLESTTISFNSFNISNISFLNIIKLYKLVQFFKNNNISLVIFNGSADLKTGGFAAYIAGVTHIVYRRGLAVSPNGSFINRFLFTKVVSHFLVNSKSTLKELFRKTGLNSDDLKVKLLYNSVKPFTQKAARQINTPLVLGNASRLVQQKGIHYLIEIGKELKSRGKEFKIKIAGTGPLMEELKQLTTSYDLGGNIEFIGFVDDMESFMNGIDIYLCTSIFEGFGFSIAEAMQAEKPVVGFDTSSNPEVIQDGKTGFIVKAFDIKSFADKVIDLMGDKVLRDEFGKTGIHFVLENFDLQKQHEKLEEFIYQKLLS